MNFINKISYHIGRSISPIVLHKYHYTCNKAFKTKEPTLIISNHLTEVDSFMLMKAFSKPMTIVAGAHLLQTKIGKILSKIFPLIFMSRGNENYKTISEIIKKLKKENVLLYPEGCRSFNGETLNISLSLAKLVKKAKCQVITFRTSGGYFVAPRWAYTTRVGKMSGEMINIYSKDEILKMDINELSKKLNSDIYENAYDRQKIDQFDYKGKRLAEGIENYLEVCPQCESIDSITSCDNKFYCTKCNLKGEYSNKGFLLQTPFDSTIEWGKWEDKKLEEYSKKEELIFSSNVKEYIIKNNKLSYQGEYSLKAYSDKMYLNDMLIPYSDIIAYSLLYYGRTLLFTYNGTYYKLTDFLAYKFSKLIDFYKENNNSANKDAVRK